MACLLKLQIPTKAKVRFSWSNPHMQFDFALSFVKFFEPSDLDLTVQIWAYRFALPTLLKSPRAFAISTRRPSQVKDIYG